MKDERLQALYAEALARRRPRVRSAGCLSPEQLQDLVERQGAEADRLRALDHVMACAACREEVEALRAVAKGTRPTPRFRVSAPVLAAAAVLLVVGSAALWRTLGTRWLAPDVPRGGDALVVVGPRDEVAPEAARRLVWRAVSGAARYQVEVLDRDGSVVFAAETTDTTATVADSVTLAPGVPYRWWVRARLDVGGERRALPREFRVRAP